MTPLIRHPADGRVHISELKQFARSPAHYRYACEHAREMTDAMEVGHLTDCLVFGGRGFAVWDKNADGVTVSNPVRRGKAFEVFATMAMGRGELVCLPSQLERAQSAASAVIANPLASALLDGCEFQRVLQWESHGLEFAAGIQGQRGGLDAFKRSGIVDLKTTADVEPDALSKHAWRMLWHVQAAAYLEGAEQAGLVQTGATFHLIAVESVPPHVVTVMRIPPDVIEEGRKSLVRWSERLRACDRTGIFPGYCEAEVEMTIPEWEAES